MVAVLLDRSAVALWGPVLTGRVRHIPRSLGYMPSVNMNATHGPVAFVPYFTKASFVLQEAADNVDNRF